MASYHLSAQIIKRSEGRSAIAAAAYRSGETLYSDRDGNIKDQKTLSDVMHSEIMLPAHAPSDFATRQNLWNAAEQIEKRKDAQLARDIVVALPHELDANERIELVKKFVQEQFVDRGMIADVNIHAPSAEGDERNIHAHIMLTTRDVDEDGFKAKNRSWNDKALLEEWREKWADHQNDYYAANGINERVDHRSLETQMEDKLEQAQEALEQGNEDTAIELTAEAIELDREPQDHLSRAAYQAARRDESHPANAVLQRFKEGVLGSLQTAQSFLDGLKRTTLLDKAKTFFNPQLEKEPAKREIADTEPEKVKIKAPDYVDEITNQQGEDDQEEENQIVEEDDLTPAEKYDQFKEAQQQTADEDDFDIEFLTSETIKNETRDIKLLIAETLAEATSKVDVSPNRKLSREDIDNFFAPIEELTPAEKYELHKKQEAAQKEAGEPKQENKPSKSRGFDR